MIEFLVVAAMLNTERLYLRLGTFYQMEGEVGFESKSLH